MDRDNPDPNRPIESPTRPQSDQGPAAGQSAGEALASDLGFLGQRANDLSGLGLGSGKRLGGQRRRGAMQQGTRISAETQSRQYWERKVIDYEEKVVDGFYDAHGTSTDRRVQGTMPSLTDLETDPGSSDFEAILVNHRSDHALKNLMQMTCCKKSKSPANEVTILVQRLAELVTDHMGGVVKDAKTMQVRWLERATELRTSLQKNVWPIGSINVGLSRHRALLFKVLADSINLPCRLVKGSHYTGMEDDALNLIKLNDQREYRVDLMATPGRLIPAGFCSGEDDKPNELEVVQSRPQPSAGKGSSQSLVMETDSDVDRKSSSQTSESFPSLPFASDDPGVGPSKVTGGTAQQLDADVVPQSKYSSEDLTFADLHPFKTKVLGKAPMEGDSSGIKISEIKESSHRNPFSENSPRLGCSAGQYNVMPCEEQSNAHVREDPLGTLENLQHGVADPLSGCGSHEISIPDLRKRTNDRFMDPTFMLKNSEGLSSSIDSNTNKVDDVDGIKWEHLDIGERIGVGSCGEVFLAHWNGTEVAVKKFFDQDLQGAALRKFKREVQIMRRLDHPNIVVFMGAVTCLPYLSIITEYLSRGSLYGLIHCPNCQIDEKIDEKRRIKMALDVARGMDFLHTSDPPIVHRDLKSLNLLVDKDWNVKVCDFGLSCLKPNTFLSTKSSSGTPAWMAPEVLRSESLNEKCDVFSFGVILWELATLRIPWTGWNPWQIVGAVGFQNHRLKITEEIDPLVGNIIRDCWKTEPNLRPSFADLTEDLKSLQRLVIPS